MEPPPPASYFSTPTRKQNVACDACRSKKVKCQRINTSQRCGQCVQKDLECTSNYIEQVQNKPRRRRFKSQDKDAADRRSDEDRVSPVRPNSSSGGASRGLSGPVDRSATASVTSASMSTEHHDVLSAGAGPVPDLSMLAWMPHHGHQAHALPQPQALVQPHAQRTAQHAPATIFSSRDATAMQADLLRYLFRPVPVLDQEWRYSDVWGMEQARSGNCDLWEERGGALWDEPPSAAHLGFWGGAEHGLEAVAVELIDSFFTLVDPRIPILDAHQFLARFQSPSTDPRGPIPHALLAVVLAFGARFVDHTLFQSDRDECTARDADGHRPRSRLIQLLVVRAREVAEMNKVYRIPTLANAQTLILLEALLSQSTILDKNYRACNLSAASRHMEQLRDAPLMHVATEVDEKTRTQVALYIIASTESALFRLRPDSWLSDVSGSSGVENLVEALPLGLNPEMEDLWLTAARTGAGIIKRLCSDLWVPRVQANGIPLTVLRDFVHDHSAWRDLYLGRLGMPASFPTTDMDFTHKMKAATTDILFHGMWLVAERAVRDFGIQETNDSRQMFAFEMQQMKERLSQEAVHSAMRITMLAALAAEQGLLRLDPLILYRPIYDAGMFLARRGQDEALGCVAGLRQYATSYPQMWELATDIETTLQKSRLVSPNNMVINPFAPGGIVG